MTVIDAPTPTLEKPIQLSIFDALLDKKSPRYTCPLPEPDYRMDVTMYDKNNPMIKMMGGFGAFISEFFGRVQIVEDLIHGYASLNYSYFKKTMAGHIDEKSLHMGPIWSAFISCSASNYLSVGEMFEAHAAEILDRVHQFEMCPKYTAQNRATLLGKILNEPTDAELVCVMCEASIMCPFSMLGASAYRRVFLRLENYTVMNEQTRNAIINEMDDYEEWPGQIDDLIEASRTKFNIVRRVGPC